MAYLTLKECAEEYNLNSATLRKKINEGKYKEVIKIGKTWLIAEEEVLGKDCSNLETPEYIPLTEYGKLHNNISPASLRLQAASGKFKTAKKIANNWVIDKNEEYVDKRVVNGNWLNYRKTIKSHKNNENE